MEMPDGKVVRRCLDKPEQGPAILFFSGGTALRETSRALIQYTHNSVHFITPFDSGGSSAELRRAFAMPAVGDIRNRLMALADQSVHGNSKIYALFTYRLSKRSSQAELLRELRRMIDGEHFLVGCLPDPVRKVVMDYFYLFMEFMPDDFDLRGASVGNLVLTAGYLDKGRQFYPVIAQFSDLAQVRGVVRPTVNRDYHLAVRLESGAVVVGQHLITGKETAPLASPVADIWVTRTLESEEPVRPEIIDRVSERIRSADMICYPPGSFYSSVIANLLPAGVGKSVAANPCRKVFVPSTGHDPEGLGMSVADQVAVIRKHLMADGVPDGLSVLDTVVLDTRGGEYPGGIERERLEAMKVEVFDLPLTNAEDAPYLDGRQLSEALVSLSH